jgi:hypothetical protein
LLFCEQEIAGPVELGDDLVKLLRGLFGEAASKIIFKGTRNPSRLGISAGVPGNRALRREGVTKAEPIVTNTCCVAMAKESA